MCCIYVNMPLSIISTWDDVKKYNRGMQFSLSLSLYIYIHTHIAMDGKNDISSPVGYRTPNPINLAQLTDLYRILTLRDISLKRIFI